MRIEKITNIYNKTFSNESNKKTELKNTTFPVVNKLNKTNTAYYNINFTGLFEASNQRKFAQAQEDFTPAANKTWNKITLLARRYNHSEITFEHVYAVVLGDLLKYIESLNSGTKQHGNNTNYQTPYTLEEITGCINLFKDEKTRNKAAKILKIHYENIISELSTLNIPKKKFAKPKPSDDLAVSLNTSYETIRKISNSDSFTDNIFLFSLFNSGNENIAKRTKKLKFEIQKRVMTKDTSAEEKNHLQFYDTLADRLWKNLDMGNNIYVTYEGENTEAEEHLISSFTNLIKKPGQRYTNLNEQNTKVIVFNPNVIFEAIASYVEEAKKDPSTTYIFVFDLEEILKTNTIVERRERILIDEDEEKLIKNIGLANVRMVIISNKNVYYANSGPNSGLKKALENYGLLSIPMIDSEGAKEILASEKGQNYIKAKTGKTFDENGIRYVVEIVDELDGYYPEKAINYIAKIASFYTDKKEITIEDIKSYEKELSNIQQKASNNTQNEFRIVFNTEKTLDDIIGSPMTKAEAKSIVNQILMSKKGYVKGFTTYLDNGSSYGGGRKHTAECIAGEAEIPMITINARDFALKDIDALSANANLSEIKIKKLINTAKAQAEANKNKTAMIFIENFDNFGSNPLFGISSIYEQKAFSQLLEEMENLRKKSDINIIIVGSTNYPETLDENIMKPYKFLNKIIIYSPQDNQDREDILRYYIRKNGLKVGKTPEEESKIIKNAAETTNYFSVVDLIYLLEKADEISRERGKTIIDKSDMTEAYLQTTTGRVSTRHRAAHEDELVAKHECGHGITLQVMYELAKKQNKPWHIPNRLNFITLDPRGTYGGAMYPKNSENDEYSFEKVFSEIVCSFGGYSCEKLFYNMEGSLGITQDIANATNMARIAVQKMGMGAKTGRISISTGPSSQQISDSLRNKIDEDIEVFLKNSEFVSNKIIEAYRSFIEQFAQKYKDRVGTGDCIITSDEFEKELEDWKNSLNKQEKENLLKLEDEIIDIIEKTKSGKIANT